MTSQFITLGSGPRHWPLDQLPEAGPDTDGNCVSDLSRLPRFGIRGTGTTAWLAARGLPLPDAVNRVARGMGLRIARLGREEVLVLPDNLADPAGVVALHADWAGDTGRKGQDAYRDEGWCWLRLTGPGTLAVLPLLTATDTRDPAFPTGSVLQTRALHLDAVLLRDGMAIDLFCDVASSDYAVAFLADVLPDHRLVRVRI